MPVLTHSVMKAHICNSKPKLKSKTCIYIDTNENVEWEYSKSKFSRNTTNLLSIINVAKY